ncbi:MAG: NAD(P)-dependent oxidoreductase [Acidobacteria bacterium]|nr:NAD(P)-dependent oxidoreductase [Acidobacteriota bacterium]
MADTVLVTGGSGFIGSHVCRMLLKRGDKAINFDLFPRRGPLAWLMSDVEREIPFEKGDVANLTQLIAVMRKHSPNKIAHAAASIDMDSLESYPAQVYHQMVGGTVNVLESMRLLGGIERMINISSIGVLPTRQYEPLDCNHPTLMAAEGPASGIYGAGKVAGEAFCWAYADLFNLDIVQLRPSAAYGFYTTNTIFMNEMLEGALRGEKVRLPHGGHLPRDYTHVHDIAGITVAALNVPASRLTHRVFYAASGMNPLVTAAETAGLVREMVPRADVDIGATMSPAIERYDLKMRGVLDVRPVEEQLGYRIKYRDIRAGMKEYADRYSEYLIHQGRTPADRAW